MTSPTQVVITPPHEGQSAAPSASLSHSNTPLNKWSGLAAALNSSPAMVLPELASGSNGSVVNSPQVPHVPVSPAHGRPRSDSASASPAMVRMTMSPHSNGHFAVSPQLAANAAQVASEMLTNGLGTSATFLPGSPYVPLTLTPTDPKDLFESPQPQPQQPDEKANSVHPGDGVKSALKSFLQADFVVYDLNRRLAAASNVRETCKQALIQHFQGQYPLKIDLSCFSQQELQEIGGPGYLSMILEARYKTLKPAFPMDKSWSLQDILSHNQKMRDSSFAKCDPKELADAVSYGLSQHQPNPIQRGLDWIHFWLDKYRTDFPQHQQQVVVRRVKISSGAKRKRTTQQSLPPIAEERQTEPPKSKESIVAAFRQRFGLQMDPMGRSSRAGVVTAATGSTSPHPISE